MEWNISPQFEVLIKKQATALATGVCLQAFALLPKDKN
jgi:hypothetical protein